VLKKAEGDWAASWFFRRRTKTHNRTLAQRRKKQKHPQRWAAKEAERKVKRFKKLHEELVEGDIETLEEALLQKALRDNEADPVDIATNRQTEGVRRVLQILKTEARTMVIIGDFIRMKTRRSVRL
jgi:phosphopantetheinyl transferase (holo-ACP synthase)